MSLGEDKVGGLLVRVGGVLHFLPTSMVLAIAPAPSVSRVPGAPTDLLGVAAHEGAIVPVISIGDERGVMVVCSYGGERLGLVGATVVGAGLFEREPESLGVSFSGEAARPLDLSLLYTRVLGGAWAGRWGG